MKRRPKGQGTQREDGSWETSVTVTAPDGTKKRIPVFGDTQREMMDNAAAVRAGKRVAPIRTQTIEELLKAFLTDRYPWSESSGLPKQSGREYHEWTGKRLVRDLGRKVAGDLTTPDVAKWLRQLAAEVEMVETKGGRKAKVLSGRTVQMHRNNLRVLLAYGREIGWVRENVAKDVRLPPGVNAKPKPRPVLTRAMSRLIRIKEPDPTLRLLLWFMDETAVRISEALACRRRHLRMVRGVWVIDVPGTKTENAPRTIPLPASLASALAKQEDWLFPSETGKTPLDYFNVEHRWVRAVARTSIPYTNLHQVRKMRLTWWIDTGVPEMAVKYLAGHSSITVTKNLYHQSQAVKAMGAFLFAIGDARFRDPLSGTGKDVDARSAPEPHSGKNSGEA